MSDQTPPEVQRTTEEAARLAKLYEAAEREIISAIAIGISRGQDMKYLTTMRDNVQAILTVLRTESSRWAEESIPASYIIGADSATEQLKRAGVGEVLTGFGGIHQQAVEILAENAYNRLDQCALVIGRRTDDIYRQLALEATRGSIVGHRTYAQAAERFEGLLSEKGITGFVDSAGREWNMKTYSRMVGITTTMEAHLEGTANRLIENGRDLVRISQNGSKHPECAQWEGKVVSLTGRTQGYPTLAHARSTGLFHPNCKHSFALHIGIDEEIKALESELGMNA